MRYDIKKHEIKVLEAFYTFPYLTGLQITNYLYSPGSYKTGVLPMLQRLAGMMSKQNIPFEPYLYRDRQTINDHYVYWLATKGRNYLTKEHGYDFSDWREPYRMKEFVQSTHLWHCLGVNDFLITAQQIPRSYPGIAIDKIIHDFTLKRLMQGASVIPDGLVQFQSGENPVIWLEYDRKSEKEEAFKTKIRRIVEFMQYGFDTWFDTPLENFSFAFPTPFGQKRVDEMRKWTQEQLTDMQRAQVGSVFLFTSLPEKYDTSIFFSDSWEMPFDSRKHSLVIV